MSPYTGSPPLESWETDDWQWFYDHREIVTEADWWSCPEPGTLLDYLNQRDAASARKFFLAGAGCVRRLWHLLESPVSRAAVEAAEQFADGALSYEQLQAHTDAAHTVRQNWAESDARLWAAFAAFQLRHDPRGNHGDAECTPYAVSDTARAVAFATGAAESSSDWTFAYIGEKRALAGLCRCALGNPFRPVTFVPEWRTDTAVALAAQMYESRDFSAMPMLADALQDAGCDSDGILNHCREPGEHVRGCWVVDLVLGKA